MSTEVAIVQELGSDKLELIKKTVAKGATDLELELFLHASKRTGLDPLMKQIYCIKRGDSMAIQTGIDGYRLIADRTGQYAGSDEPQYIIGDDGFPDVASVTVTKIVSGVPCKFSASARWKEYCQTNSPMWKKMPFLMLGKCAEALALRKAFPAELSGVYTHEEMMQADTEPHAHPIITNKQTAQEKIAELRHEMQEPARQDGGAAQPQVKHTSPVEAVPQQGPDAAAPCVSGVGTADPTFMWKMGKWKDHMIEAIPLDYLAWACTNISRADHKKAALDEIDRRQKQDHMNFEAQG